MELLFVAEGQMGVNICQALTTAASIGARKLTRPSNQGIIGKFEILVLDHEYFHLRGYFQT